MYKKINFNKDNFDEGLVTSVGNRINNGEYTDAILAATKYLTDILREKGDTECDFSGPFPHLVFTTIPPGRAL